MTTAGSSSSSYMERADSGYFTPARSISTQGTSRISSVADFDILPSFYMHQSILNKNVFENNFAHPSNPLPTYSAMRRLPNHPTTDYTASMYSSKAGESILNNIEKLPEIKGVPFEIEIFVTEEPALKHQLYDDYKFIDASKEYTSGDYVWGFFTLKNLTDKPVAYEQITVALEGNVIIGDSKMSNSTIKNFLRMVDLSGSFTQVSISTDNSGAPLASEDVIDGTITCFGDKQVALPRATYKRFFRFKFPHQLLDETCPTFQNGHLALPPSFGFDQRFIKYYTTTSASRRRRQHNVGVPLHLIDYSLFNATISYSLEVRVVSERGSSSKGLESRSEDGYKFGMTAKSGYYLRFVPYTYNSFDTHELSTKKQIEILLKNLRNELNELNRRIELGLTAAESIPGPSREEILERKMIQLSLMEIDPQRSKSQKVEFRTTIPIVRQQKLIGLYPKSERPNSRLGDVEVEVMPLIKNLSYEPVGSHASAVVDLGNFKMTLLFKGTSDSTKPPAIHSLKTSLVVITLYSTFSIPVSIDPTFLLDRSNLEITRNRFSEVIEGFKKLPKTAKVHSTTLNDMNAMKNLTDEYRKLFIVEMPNMKMSEWTVKEDQSSSDVVWTKNICADLKMTSTADSVLLPNFQSCYVSRFYHIEFAVSFGSLGEGTISVPVIFNKEDGGS